MPQKMPIAEIRRTAHPKRAAHVAVPQADSTNGIADHGNRRFVRRCSHDMHAASQGPIRDIRRAERAPKHAEILTDKSEEHMHGQSP